MTLAPPDAPAEPGLAAIASLAATPFAGIDEAIAATLTLIGDVFGVGLAMVHRLEGDDIVVSHVSDRIGLGVRPPLTVPRRDTFCDETPATLAPLLVPDADADPRFRDRLGKRLVGTRTYIGVPILLRENRVFGTLCAHDRRVLDLGAADIDALLVLSRLIATQIERDEALAIAARSAHRLERQNVDLTEAVRQLDALREIAESISAELDLAALLDRIVASAIELLGGHGGAIDLIGEAVAGLRHPIPTHHPVLPAPRGAPACADLTERILAARGPVRVESCDDPDASREHAAFHALGPWLGVPVWWKGEIVATFAVGGNDPARRFGEREAELLTLLAKHAAVAIENARLYAASRHLGAAEERNRLAREIHDTLAQSLLALTLQIRSARGLVAGAPDRAAAELTAAESHARAALEEARRSVWNLGPAALAVGTLVEALEEELAAAEGNGLPGRLVVSGAPRPLPAEGQLTLLRVAQEALCNARRHARAGRAEIALAFGPAEATLTIADDGIGFDPDLVARRGLSPTGGFGLPAMAERVGQAGGRFRLESAPGRGTHVLATAPYGPSLVPPVPTPSRPAARAIRVVIADDHPAVRAGVVALLEAQPDIAVVGQAGDGEEALRLVAGLRPDVLLVDLRMPKLPGVDVIRRLGELEVPTRAVVVTSFAQDEVMLDALRAGAQGYLLKDAAANDLAAAVRVAAAGGIFLDPAVAGTLARGLAAPPGLTARQREVLNLIGRGLPDKEIAARLGTTAKTVNFHVANVLTKLGAHNRAEAVRLAFERGLLGGA